MPPAPGRGLRRDFRACRGPRGPGRPARPSLAHFRSSGFDPIPGFTSPAFAGRMLRFSVAGAGLSFDQATGTVGIAADRLQQGLEVTVTASGPDGTAGSFRILIQAQQPPRLLTAPALAGPATIGTAVGVDPGTWEEAAALALQWCRDGAEIAGATGASYTPVAADDRTALSCRVTASNPAGSTAAETAALPVTRRARRWRRDARRSRAGRSTAAAGSVAAAAAFTGAGLSYAVSGAGATIDAATGVVSLPTAALVSAATVTVTASNSGGSASASFQAQRGGGGAGAGDRAEAHRQRQDRRGGQRRCRQLERQARARHRAAMAPRRRGYRRGDRRRATRRWRRTTGPRSRCRVTASNVAGSAVATTAALPVTRVAPVASGTLADVELIQGAAAGSVAAAAAFTGAGLGYAVSGGGATIDAATGVVSLPTAALVSAATVTVTASNSGGSAAAGFRLSVVARGSGTVVSSRQALLEAIVASSDGDVIRIAPGVYDRFIWPKNTSHRLTLAPAQIDNPPILRGIWISGAANAGA